MAARKSTPRPRVTATQKKLIKFKLGYQGYGGGKWEEQDAELVVDNKTYAFIKDCDGESHRIALADLRQIVKLLDAE